MVACSIFNLEKKRKCCFHKDHSEYFNANFLTQPLNGFNNYPINYSNSDAKDVKPMVIFPD